MQDEDWKTDRGSTLEDRYPHLYSRPKNTYRIITALGVGLTLISIAMIGLGIRVANKRDAEAAVSMRCVASLSVPVYANWRQEGGSQWSLDPGQGFVATRAKDERYAGWLYVETHITGGSILGGWIQLSEPELSAICD